MSQNQYSLDGTAWAALIFLSVLWGGAFFFAGVAVKELPPLTVVWARVALAAAMLTPVFVLGGHNWPRGIAGWAPFMVMGLLNNVIPFGLLFIAQTQITAGLASIINATTPLFAILIAAGFGEEKLTAPRIAGIMLAVAGVAILKGVAIGVDDGQVIGIALSLGAAFSYGCAALWGRRRLAGITPLKLATCQLICSSLIMTAIAPVIDKPWQYDLPGQGVWLSILALAFLGTALAYIVFFFVLRRAGASNATLVTLLVPVTAVLLGRLFLDETVQLTHIVGMLVIALGLLCIDGRLIALARTWFRRRF